MARNANVVSFTAVRAATRYREAQHETLGWALASEREVRLAVRNKAKAGVVAALAEAPGQ